jgi:hypothetical protein
MVSIGIRTHTASRRMHRDDVRYQCVEDTHLDAAGVQRRGSGCGQWGVRAHAREAGQHRTVMISACIANGRYMGTQAVDASKHDRQAAATTHMKTRPASGAVLCIVKGGLRCSRCALRRLPRRMCS